MNYKPPKSPRNSLAQLFLEPFCSQELQLNIIRQNENSEEDFPFPVSFLVVKFRQIISAIGPSAELHKTSPLSCWYHITIPCLMKVTRERQCALLGDEEPADVSSVSVDRAIDYTYQLLRLFTSHHRFTPERFEWLQFWVGLDELAKGRLHRTVVHYRMQFLKENWDNYAEFRPFDTIESSEEFLIDHPHADYLLRLSTRAPGKITYTRRVGENINHTRITVTGNSQLQLSDGTCVQDMHQLCDVLTQKYVSNATRASHKVHAYVNAGYSLL